MTITEDLQWGNLRTVDTFQFVDNLSWLKGAHSFRFGTNMRFQRHTDTRGSVGGANVSPTVELQHGREHRGYRRPSASRRTSRPRTTGPRSSPASISCSDASGTLTQGFVQQGDAYGPGGTLFDFEADYPEIDFYAQDTWKPRSNVTVDLGLR